VQRLLFVVVAAAAACSGGASAPVLDAGVTVMDTALLPDTPAAAIDAAPAGVCGADLVLTGNYVDWDSTPESFVGVAEFTLTQVADPQNTATAAPNGRGTLCLPGTAATSFVDFTHPNYLDLRYSVWPEAARRGPFEMKGLTAARADALGFAPEPGAAVVLVAVRTYNSDLVPGDPTAGARVTLGNPHTGAFVDDGTGTYQSGDTVAAGAYVLFRDVAVGAGQTDVVVTAPAGVTCVGPAVLDLVPGAIAAATFACAAQ
jgi:hypothetical protein